MAGTTTNFGFDYPTSTDYVKDGATAIQTLADDVDARFGNVATYPNQIVNRVSGVSRPVPYAQAVGSAAPVFTASNSASITVTFPASRFTVSTPIITLTNFSASGSLIASTYRALSITSSSFTITGTATTAVTATGAVFWNAIQMTSASASG